MLSCPSSSADPTFLSIVFAVKYVEMKNKKSVLEKKALIHMCVFLPDRGQPQQVVQSKDTFLRVPWTHSTACEQLSNYKDKLNIPPQSSTASTIPSFKIPIQHQNQVKCQSAQRNHVCQPPLQVKAAVTSA